MIGGTLGYFIQSKNTNWLASLFVGLGFLGAISLVFVQPLVIRWGWTSTIEFGVHIDQLSAILISLVYLISFLVHVFSLHYMKGDPGIKRYFFKLGFFTTSMLGLLAADHLLLVFVFWELVGFSSYLLIGFWFKDIEKATSAKTAFMVNRMADAALLIGIILLISVFDLSFISEMKASGSSALITFTGIALAIGAFGKSAQFPFFGWLNKAMAGPTPVSALIHAATMVTAGIYLLVRVFPFLTEEVLMIVAFVGAFTAFMAGVSALFQNDIKAVLAYSTISQLGYMILGVGVGAFQSSIFHLWTHAFFKAGLFLAAGNVIHFIHKANHDADAQEMRNMGGLKRFLPFTFVTYVVCGAALAGLPFTSGFLSKEGILGAVLEWFATSNLNSGLTLFVLMLAFTTALLTPFYITRQILLVFLGQPRTELVGAGKEDFEPWMVVKLPLILLSLGSVWLLVTFNPFDGHGWHLNEFLFGSHLEVTKSSLGLITLIASIVLVTTGLFLAIRKYKPGSQYVLDYKNESRTSFLSAFWKEGWYIDRFYNLINRGFLIVSTFAFWLDKKVVDRAVEGVGVGGIIIGKTLGVVDRYVVDGFVNLLAGFFRWIGSLLTRIQAPGIQTQLMVMLSVLVFLIYWFLF